jgi:hypothetical protein
MLRFCQFYTDKNVSSFLTAINTCVDYLPRQFVSTSDQINMYCKIKHMFYAF